MIDILDKSDCTGCALCHDVCPNGAITMIPDSVTGFLFPVINKDCCIKCNLCEAKCPSLNLVAKAKNVLNAFAVNNKNIEIRFDSTSGGVFASLANYFYIMNGAVVGAVWKNKYEVIQIASTNKDDLPNLMLSKYIQSNSCEVYTKVKDLLRKGVKVLFVGLPCQIAAIRSICEAEDNLYTVDLVCKGVPSPLVWRKYIDSIESSIGKTIICHRSKDKEYGWKRLGVRVDFDDTTVDYHSGSEDDFVRLYSRNVIMRDSCYHCKYRGIERVGDLTLGDCWGVEHLSPKLDDNCGTSMVFINTKKGADLYSQICDSFDAVSFKAEDIDKYNKGISSNFVVDELWRREFWRDINNYPFKYVVEKYASITAPKGINKFLKKCYNIYCKLGQVTGFRIRPLCQFIRYNFFSKHIIRHNGALLYPSTYCNFSFEDGAVIELYGDFMFGDSRMKNTTRESRIFMRQNSKIIIRKQCHISEGADIEMHRGAVWSMDTFYANFNLEVSCGELIDMRDDVGAGRKVTIRDYNGHLIAKNGFLISAPIIIENHTWLCSGCTIMPGVHIGTGAIISANAYVASNVPPYTIMSGKPAVIMGKDVKHQI